MSSKKKIILHGYLADLHKEPIEVEAETVAEAIRSLNQFDWFRCVEQPHRIKIDGVTTDIALFSKTNLKEIHVRPFTGGAGGRNGLLQIIIGAAVIAVTAGLGGAAFTAFGGAITGSSLYMAGATMILGGILQMLAPMPDASINEGEGSKYLGAGVNTVKIGTPIPLAYGFCKLGGHYLSFDVDAFNDGTESKATSIVKLPPVESFVQTMRDVMEQLNPGKADGPVEVTIEGADNLKFYLIDAAGVEHSMLNPVFDSPVASQTNIPTSEWNG